MSEAAMTTMNGSVARGGLWARVRDRLLALLGGRRAVYRTIKTTATADESKPLPETEVVNPIIEPRGSLPRAISKSSTRPAGPHAQVREKIAQVPPLPHVVRQLLQELSDPNSSSRSVASLAASDPALAAALMRTVNSSAYGLRRRVTSVAEAVTYLGYVSVRSLLVRMRLEKVLPARTARAAYDAEDLWIHSLAVANAAECLAERVPAVDKALVATLGLLHDIGKLAVNSYFPESAAQLQTRDAEHAEESFLDRERRILGADHAELGAMLAAHWKLPAEIVEAIRHHHNPAAAPEALAAPLRHAMTIVHLANQIAKYCYVYSEDMEIDIIDDELIRSINLTGPLPRLLTTRVRRAISRAIFFADFDSRRPLNAIRRFVHICTGEEAQRAMAVRRSTAPGEMRVTFDKGGIDEMFTSAACHVELLFGGRTRADDPMWKRQPSVIVTGDATSAIVERMVDALIDHQNRLKLDTDARLPARFMIRWLLPNLFVLGGGGDRVEVAQSLHQGRLWLAIRCKALRFSKRFGRDVEPRVARRVIEAELANVLNLRWFSEVRISEDGAGLLMITHAAGTQM